MMVETAPLHVVNDPLSLGSVMNGQTENVMLDKKRCSQRLEQECLCVCMWRIVITLKKIWKCLYKKMNLKTNVLEI